MSSADNHTNSWSDADIQRYLKGELPAREMHELEKAALDDPFLSDALEGLAMPHADADLGELRARLDTRVDEKKQAPPILWFRKPAFRVAAAVILLAGVGVTAYYTLLNGKEHNENTAVAKTTAAPPAQQPAQPPPAQPSPAEQPPAAMDSTRLSDDAVAASRPTVPAPTRRSHKQARSIAAMESEKEKNPSEELSGKAEADILYKMDSVQANARMAARKSIVAAPPASAFARPPLLISGLVVDAYDRPLAGASLFLKGYSNFSTTTNTRGQFSFRLPPQDTARQMTVALVGYQQTSFALNTDAQTNNIIRLQEAKTSLDEVVVTGYGKQRKETLAAAPSDGDERLDSVWLKVYPVSGRLAYEQYLAAAKKTLKLDSAILGTERISFQVDQKGQITNFKIEQSVSPAHDAGLIQLISTGPAWKLLHGKKARAVVSLSFP